MIDKLTKGLIHKCIHEIKKDENKQQIEMEIINPFMNSISLRIYPYITLLFFMYSLILILIIIILIVLIYKSKK